MMIKLLNPYKAARWIFDSMTSKNPLKNKEKDLRELIEDKGEELLKLNNYSAGISALNFCYKPLTKEPASIFFIYGFINHLNSD